jgi:hypothetical protein
MPGGRTAHATTFVIPRPAFHPSALRGNWFRDPFKHLTSTVEHTKRASAMLESTDVGRIERTAGMAVQTL